MAAADGRDVHDVPRAAGTHHGKDGTRGVDGAEEVDLEILPELLIGKVLDVPDAAVAGEDAAGKSLRLGRTRRPLISSAELDVGRSPRPCAQPHGSHRSMASRMMTSAAAPTTSDERAGDRVCPSRWASSPQTRPAP